MSFVYMAVCQNLVPLVNIKIAGKWMFIPLKMVLIGIDPYPHIPITLWNYWNMLTVQHPIRPRKMAKHSPPFDSEIQTAMTDSPRVEKSCWGAIGRAMGQSSPRISKRSLLRYEYDMLLIIWTPKMEGLSK